MGREWKEERSGSRQQYDHNSCVGKVISNWMSGVDFLCLVGYYVSFLNSRCCCIAA